MSKLACQISILVFGCKIILSPRGTHVTVGLVLPYRYLDKVKYGCHAW